MYNAVKATKPVINMDYANPCKLCGQTNPTFWQARFKRWICVGCFKWTLPSKARRVQPRGN